jgi:hypothetical protein
MKNILPTFETFSLDSRRGSLTAFDLEKVHSYESDKSLLKIYSREELRRWDRAESEDVVAKKRVPRNRIVFANNSNPPSTTTGEREKTIIEWGIADAPAIQLPSPNTAPPAVFRFKYRNSGSINFGITVDNELVSSDMDLVLQKPFAIHSTQVPARSRVLRCASTRFVWCFI